MNTDLISVLKHIQEEVVGRCGCFHGFYHSACETNCAGGANYPCYGKGTCDRGNGKCTCDTTADVKSDCSVCHDGWFGEDCSVADIGLQGTCIAIFTLNIWTEA